MSTTTLTRNEPAGTHVVSRRLDERRLAGIGGLTFASIVLVTNVLQGAVPAMDASADEVVTYLTDHRTESLFATAAFAVGSG
ncbi:MAG: hypothetical protein HZB15_05445 [Actinobacteria bacterium]|nr:hypothetical protein [Actinomycetota bacterium]